MPHLSVLSPILPTAPLVGGTAHIVGALRQLARAYHVSLCALAPDLTTPIWPPLFEYCDQVHVFQRPRSSGWGVAPPAVRQEHSAELRAFLEHTWRRQHPDIVQLEFTSMAQYAPLARQTGALVVCIAHNVAFLAQIRRARLQHGAMLRGRRWLGALSLWLYELLMLPRCHLVVTHSLADKFALQRWLPHLPVVYIPSGVDLEDRPICFDPHSSDEVLFVGSYQHPPNVEGALWLVREVWPLVRRAHPGARLTLAGRAPPPSIQALAAADICVPGTVANLQPYYGRSTMMVAPIFWGSGVRIKILDALAYGLPLVTTAVAAEGIDLVQDQSALFAEQPAEFASAILRLLDDPALRIRLSAAGRAVVERDYDWNQIGRRLLGLFEGARASRALAHRSGGAG